MKQYKLINNLTGWLVFAIAAFTYCMTVEPTASFWDCPEFITAAYKGEVGHPPGAPFFMLTANFFTQFASDPTQVALCVNIMSALLSALCILFLFWSITHLTRKLITPEGLVTNAWQTVLIMGAGLTGALAYTWSDTFWYSAVEGEVYAYSSMLTALVFWLILKWEDHADEPHSDRWLILIFYLTGLSIGVHLLNLLCLPAITLVYYFKKHPETKAGGAIAALAVSVLLVIAVLYGVVPGIVKVGGVFELFFVNVLGFDFNTGLVFYLLLLIAVVLVAIWSTTQKNKRTLTTVLYTLSVVLLGIPFFLGHGAMAIIFGLLLAGGLVFLLLVKRNGEYVLRKRFLNTSLLCMLMLMIGYSSYAVTVIRSSQNPPMDQNSPEDIFTLGTYMGREQYGENPLFYGQAFSSEPKFESVLDENGQPLYYANGSPQLQTTLKEGTRTQRHEKKTADEADRYETVAETKGAVYPSEFKMLFPRMWSSDSRHVRFFNDWLGEVDMKDVSAVWDDVNADRLYAYGYFPVYGQMPSQVDNIRFFLSYQVNFMYWRYFMWNFAGRQNDVQGNGEPEHGNWITGIPFIDNALYGDQEALPDELKNNKGRNVFFCLPLLLGLIGLFWQAFSGRKGIQQFWVVFFLFFMTGLAIVLYLNQYPNQPRERDYAYAGSFYAFAIWIGLGVAAIGSWLNRVFKGKEVIAASIASVICIFVPFQMVSQTWDDHDRSDRYACRDFGMNYLNTLPEEGMPIIFTNGDNDTFPLWYSQDVEEQRTDARVCNLSYLQTDWYIDQMRRPAYKSASLPIAWDRYEYVDGRGLGFDYYLVKPEMRKELDEIKAKTGVNTYELKYIIDNYIRAKVRADKPGVMPTDSVVIPVNKEAIRKSGMILPYGKDSIPDYITLSFAGKSYIDKSDMMVYEMMARNDWKRPMYMSATLGAGNYAGMDEYLVLEGLAYRITPFKGLAIDTDKMYDNMMNRFKYGNVNKPGIYLDETVLNMCYTHRHMFATLVDNLVRGGEMEKAAKALTKCKEVLPPENIPYKSEGLELAKLWLAVGKKAEAERIAIVLATRAEQYLRWMSTLSENRQYRMIMGGVCKEQLGIFEEALGIMYAADSKRSDEFLLRAGDYEYLPFENKLPIVSLFINVLLQEQEQRMREEQQNSNFNFSASGWE